MNRDPHRKEQPTEHPVKHLHKIVKTLCLAREHFFLPACSTEDPSIPQECLLKPASLLDWERDQDTPSDPATLPRDVLLKPS